MTNATAPTADTSADVALFLASFAAIHRAMREDARTLADQVGSADADRAAALVRWFGRFRASIEHHHNREDELIWPQLAERSPGFTADLAVLTEDHHELDRSLARTTAALHALGADPDGVRAEAVAAARELATVLADHLDREEASAFPRLSVSYTAEEYGELEEQIRTGTSLGQMAFEAPWVLDRMAAETQAELLGDAPAALRLLYRFVFVPRYRRLATAALG
jgi:hemerythrin-like domain-containing protein